MNQYEGPGLILSVALLTLEPVLVLLTVGHGGAFEGLGFPQLFLTHPGLGKVDPAEVCAVQTGAYYAGTTLEAPPASLRSEPLRSAPPRSVS